MSDKGTPHNVGQALFQSAGAGLQAFGPLMQQEKENKLRDLQLAMNMERFEQQKELTATRIELANLQLGTALEESYKTTEQKAQEKAEAQIVEFETFLRQFVGDPLSGIAEAGGVEFNLGELQQIVPQQSGLVPQFNFGGLGLQQQEQPFDIGTVFNQATDLGLEPSGVSVTPEGDPRFSFARPPQDPTTKPKTDAEKRAALKNVENRERASILEQAAAIYRDIPLEVKQELEIGEIINFKDLSNILIHPKISGKKESRLGFDFLKGDTEGLPVIFQQLQKLAADYKAIGTKKRGGFGPDGSFPTEREYLDAQARGFVR